MGGGARQLPDLAIGVGSLAITVSGHDYSGFMEQIFPVYSGSVLCFDNIGREGSIKEVFARGFNIWSGRGAVVIMKDGS